MSFFFDPLPPASPATPPPPPSLPCAAATGYAAVPTSKLVYGEHRDLGFATLHAATGTQPIDKAAAEAAPLVVPVGAVRSS